MYTSVWNGHVNVKFVCERVRECSSMKQNERKKSHYHCLIYYPVGNVCECKYVRADNRTTNNFCFINNNDGGDVNDDKKMLRCGMILISFNFEPLFSRYVRVFTADLTELYE